MGNKKKPQPHRGVDKSAVIIGVVGFVVLTIIVAAIVGVVLKMQENNEGTHDIETEKIEYNANVDMAAVSKEINSKLVTDFEETDSITEYVKISIVDHGEIVVRLRKDIAPISVDNFQTLVHKGFYDGLTFHRIIQNFMIQGGQNAEEKVDTIKGEFTSNGVKNDLLHLRGVISMARTPVLDSATSQFFICDATSDHLDGDYAAFGYVVAGMDTVDSVAAVPTDSGNAPLTKVVMNKVCFVTEKTDDETNTDTANKDTESSISENLFMAAVGAEIDAKDVADFTETHEATEFVKITVKDHGDMIIRLRADIAPLTVANFRTLVAGKFYDGLTFHHIAQGALIQGGRNDGIPMESIKGEFAANGVPNQLLHLRGVISMARSAANNSATSEFFICDTTDAQLDGQYAAFGYVVAGLEVVDSIAAVTLDVGNAPVMEKVCFVTPNE